VTLETTATHLTSYPELARATAALETPYAVLDLGALHANAEDLVRRAAGTPIRVASKSVRCREVLRRTLALPGYAGVLAYTLPEALWLAGDVDDVVVGYPSVDRTALAQLASDELLASRVTLMIDSVEQLELTAAAIGAGGPRVRVCIELDASLRLAGGRVHLGARRSPTHTPAEAAALARTITEHPRFALVGLMAYEGQIAGLGDNQPGVRKYAVRAVQRLSVRELADRRAAAEAAVTEVAAGSGLFGPHLFDHYTRFRPRPAAHFVLSVVRRPSRRHATVLGGGWIASGAVGPDRLPTPVWPQGLELVPAEGAGEVQTPLRGKPADDLRVGDRVWFRHAKAGELCEHVDALHALAGDEVTDVLPTYRGEGRTFG
jgi:D-serine deaminase-like pyridoxal phosphate-dependent protein